MEFVETVKAANVSDIKLMSDLLKMANAEVQMTFYQLKLDTQLKDQDYTTEDWNKFCDTIAQLGGLVSQITVKSDICAYYFTMKTPDCFKN
jgi:UDP-N-acetylglucosamine enolpyruvyl transferase